MDPVIQTYDGDFFDFTRPDTSMITIRSIAHALSNICRFTGHCSVFYSVAQHSVLASYLVEPEHALTALMHDAAEAFIGDVSSPLKQLLPDYKIIERRIEENIAKRFGLPAELPACVKLADLVMLATEQRDLMPFNPGSYWSIIENITPNPHPIRPWSSREAYANFRERFAELDMARGRTGE